jgi:hypothetical protein
MSSKFKAKAERKEGITQPGREKIQLLSYATISLSQFFSMLSIESSLQLTSE